MQSITRKFLVKNLPDLSGKVCVTSHRFYLYRRNGIVIRIQSKDNKFELERKEDKSNLIRESEKMILTKDEFDTLSSFASDSVVRDSYLISGTPQTVLRIYHGNFEGLVRAEIEFLSLQEAEKFIPYKWLGREITETPLAKEGTLLDLTADEFKDLIN